MATVTKNFRIKSGLIVEGTTGTINGQNILTETGGNAYLLNLVAGATLVKSVDAGTFAVDGAGNLTVKPNTFDSYGSASAAQAAAATDATNKSAAAQSAAQAFATSADTTLLGTVTTNIATAKSAAEATASADATSKADAAQAAAEATASADATSKVAAEAALRVSGDAASVATAAADATTKADAAQAAAATDATTKANAAQAAAEVTAANALNALAQGTSRFSEVNISNTTSQKATKATLTSAGTAVATSWLKADFPTAKLIVKFETATHTQVSEVLLSSDASNNIAITEYASVGTNGDLGTTSASYGQGYINVDVVTVNPDTTVTVMATLIK